MVIVENWSQIVLNSKNFLIKRIEEISQLKKPVKTKREKTANFRRMEY